MPWVNVGGFYNFLINNYSNKNRGPAGFTTDLNNVQVGDPIFMKISVSWEHAVIVDSVVYPRLPSNIFVTAHSGNYYHRPLAEYGGYTWFPLHMAGYYNNIYLPVVFNSATSMSQNGMQIQDLYPGSGDFGGPYPPP